MSGGWCQEGLLLSVAYRWYFVLGPVLARNGREEQETETVLAKGCLGQNMEPIKDGFDPRNPCLLWYPPGDCCLP